MIHVHIKTRILSDQLSQLLHISTLDSSQHDAPQTEETKEKKKEGEKGEDQPSSILRRQDSQGHSDDVIITPWGMSHHFSLASNDNRGR